VDLDQLLAPFPLSGGTNSRYNRVVNRAHDPHNRPTLLDPGWLFLLAGLAVLGATVLIPAEDDLAKARWQRDRALAIEAHRAARISRYEEYLAALDNRDPSLVLSLAESQLNQIPADRAPLPGYVPSGTADASVFPSLEPPPFELPERRRIGSILERWTTDNGSRLWLIAAGAACLLIGLLPQSRGWSNPGRQHPYLQ
jgi:hypothetical protein